MSGIGSSTSVLVIGGGPAGLTAAYDLAKAKVAVTVVDEHQGHWGGIARTEEYRGYRFDIGGHRFFSKSAEVEALWDEILPEPLLVRPRKSRILYAGKFYAYPLDAFEALRNLGPLEALRCVGSYLRARMRPVSPVRTFEDWVTNAFGSRLFNTFFKTYTEKVWGMPCSAISADWAAQRIRGLSLSKAVWHALLPASATDGGATIKTLIGHFRYPRLGPGMMWNAAASRIKAAGGQLKQGYRVCRITRSEEAACWHVMAKAGNGSLLVLQADYVISSMPLRELVQMLEPEPPEQVRAAAAGLRYRDFVTVALIVKDRQLFDDNWIYIHDPAVRVGRVQNFKSWSPEMVPGSGTACYGLEYFCHEGDGLWEQCDEDLLNLGATELTQLKLMQKGDLIDGTVVRQVKAYPVYDADYEVNVEVVRRYLDTRHPSLQVVGRNGMHKYNNQDHAMMTALIVARNIRAGSRRYDPWTVNDDAEYHESVRDRVPTGLRDVPTRIAE